MPETESRLQAWTCHVRLRITNVNTAMHSSTITSIGAAQTGTIALRWPAFLAVSLGLAILYLVGFSSFPRAHNAAHDTRHANGFPCH
jgi:cobalt transporter subunit CbtB